MNTSKNQITGSVPTDHKFIELYKNVMTGELPFYSALIKQEGIVPFSDYKPTIPRAYLHFIIHQIGLEYMPKLHVYQENDKFIMSDDYNTYYSYILLNVKNIPCYVMGEPIGEYVLEKQKIADSVLVI